MLDFTRVVIWGQIMCYMLCWAEVRTSFEQSNDNEDT